MTLVLQILGAIALVLYIARTIDLWWGEWFWAKRPWG